MGIYVNPGNAAFEMSRFSSIYVDKSMLITKLNAVYKTDRRFVCVSRPRRFGKSMAASMLCAYYSCGCNSASLFSGLKAETDKSFQRHLNQHCVIRLDMQQFLESRHDLDTFIGKIESRVTSELKALFPDNTDAWPDIRLKECLGQIFSQTKKGFVFIIDEWDCVFRVARQRKDIQKDYLDFLRGLFKGQDYVELAYMTGILPIKKYGEHSAINDFDEYSMISPKNLDEYFGFTETEVQMLCRKHGMDDSEMENWYNGYRPGTLSIYNPKSVSDALTWQEFQSYWTGTETYEALKTYIDMDFDGLREAVAMLLGGGCLKISTRKFQNDMTTFKSKDDVLTLLVHLGYLTYDKKDSCVLIPNREISQEFLNALDEPAWNGLTQALRCSRQLLQDTWELNEKAVADGISKIHSETASLLKYNNENSLTCTILMAYYSAKAYYLNPLLEFPSGKGFADVAYLPKKNIAKPALIIELKWDKPAKDAIRQIKEKQYASWIENYTGDILFIGISYDTKHKKHSCIIETHTKACGNDFSNTL